MRDLRYALRALWRQKGFTVAAVLTLAIGLGANTALFGLINAFLRPMPVPDARQIVTIAAGARDDQSGGFQYNFSLEQAKDLQSRLTTVTDVFGATPRIGGVSADGKPYQFFFTAVTDNYFSALRITPALGQLFTHKSGSPVSVVLGYSFWQQHFGGRPDVIGRPVRVDGHAAVITGVVPQTFRGTFIAIELDGYVDVEDLGAIDPDVNAWLYHNRKARPMTMWGRLAHGRSLADANEEVASLLDALALQYPDSDRGITARVLPEPLTRPVPMRAVSDVIPAVQMLGVALSALIVLLACMNVANLMLVRATTREREMAVRAALGASRFQLVRQMVVEGLLLSGMGAVAGFGVGQWVLRAYVKRLDFGADLPFAFDVGFDWRVFLYALAAAAVTGVGIGLWPAWRASRADARAALHDGGRGHSDSVDRQRVRRVLVVGQIAGSLALLIVAGLFIRSLVSARHIDLGFDAAHLVTVRMDPRQVGYDEARTGEFYKDLLRRVRAWPDVADAAYAFNVPMSYLAGGGAFYIEGRPAPANGQPAVSFMNHVGEGYFDTMGIPLLRGRGFTEDDLRDRATSVRVAIVNETMAGKFFPGQDPIGKRMRVYDATRPPVEIVGVAKDSKYVLIYESPRPFIYLPEAVDNTVRTLNVRAKGDPALLIGRLEREIGALAPELPIADLRTMSQSLSGLFGYLVFRIGAIQATGMGLIGLALALVGVYGVISFGASLRTREIGIRMALGAEPRDVLRMILGQGVSLIGVGLVIGVAAAFGLGRVLARLLPLVNVTDWVTFGAIALGLAALALAACYLPARRATKVPPMTALRHE